ncbi:MAG: LPS-assembly protein LptD [Candidatus Aminicenantaceae bacterium]
MLVALVVSVLFSPGWTRGQAASTASEIKIVAEHEERVGDIIRAWGKVRIEYKEIRLFAEWVEINTETKDVLARGEPVTLHLPGETISMEELQGNLDSTEGIMEKVHGQVQPSMTYAADRVERIDQDHYRMERAWFTSCSQPTPRWRFTSSRANFKKDDYMEMWNSVLYLKKVPVFYLPYFRYPLDEERSTGFLMPAIGYNGQKGFALSQSFYWAMRRNMDATFSLDYYSARGLGAASEYRYIFPHGIGGQFQLYYFRFKDEELYNTKNAYIVRFNHNQPLPYDFRLVADVDWQSSFDFLREFDNNFKRATVSNRSSQVYLSRSWSYFNWNFRVSRFETYYRDRDSSIIRLNLPEAGFTASRIKLFSPLYFSFNTSFNSWEYGWDTDYEKGEQRKSQSFAFRPTLFLPFTSIPWMSVNATFTANLDYYFQSYAPGTSTVVNEPVFTQNHSSSLELLGPTFVKVFYGQEGQPKLKHVLEPTLRFVYDSPVSASDRIITPRFFIRDYYLFYGMTNSFMVKEELGSRDLVTLSLGQRYYFDPATSPLQNYTVDGEIPSSSDFEGSIRYMPSARYNLYFTAGYNPYENTFSRLRLSLNLGAPTDNLFLRVNWYKSSDPYRQESAFARHQIGFYTGIKIPRWSLDTLAQLDYNIQENELLYSALSVVYHYQCIDFRADLRVFYYRDTPEVQFSFSFELGNIGRSMDLLGGLGF